MADGKQFVDPDAEERCQLRQQRNIRQRGPGFPFADCLEGYIQVIRQFLLGDRVFRTQLPDDTTQF